MATAKHTKLTNLKKNKANNVYFDPDTLVAFNDAKEQKVIGRLEVDPATEKYKLVEFDETCYNICLEKGFAFDESLVEEASEEQSEEKEASEAEKEVASRASSNKESTTKEERVTATKETESRPEQTKEASLGVTKELLRPVEVSRIPKTDFRSQLSELISSYENLETQVSTLSQENSSLREKIASLESVLSTTRSELEMTKTKFKNVLKTMQDSL